MSVRVIIFVQALATFIIGIMLSSQGLPSDEVSVTGYAGSQIIDSLDSISDNPSVHKVAEQTKSSLVTFGYLMTLVSITELIGLGVSVVPRR